MLQGKVWPTCEPPSLLIEKGLLNHTHIASFINQNRSNEQQKNEQVQQESSWLSWKLWGSSSKGKRATVEDLNADSAKSSTGDEHTDSATEPASSETNQHEQDVHSEYSSSIDDHVESAVLSPSAMMDDEITQDSPNSNSSSGDHSGFSSNINSLSGQFPFPETDRLDAMGKPMIGIAFSGGGSRSASCTMGQLRALHHLGLIEQTRYFSAVSGSSWTLMPFLYGDVDREWFLGVVPPPPNPKDNGSDQSSSIPFRLERHHIFGGTSCVLEYMQHKKKLWSAQKKPQLESLYGNSHGFQSYIRSAYVSHHIMPDPSQTLPFRIENFSVLSNFFSELLWKKHSNNNILRYASSYSRILHDTFISPFHQSMAFDHYMSWTRDDAQSIINRNEDFLSMEDFNTYKHENDPFIIINGCLLNLQQKDPHHRKALMEFTPLYVGCSRLFSKGYQNDKNKKPSLTVGGVYMEPHIFNSFFCDHDSGVMIESDEDYLSPKTVRVPIQENSHRLSVSDTMSVTSAAPAQAFAQRGLRMFPRFFLWSPWAIEPENHLSSHSDQLHKLGVPEFVDEDSFNTKETDTDKNDNDENRLYDDSPSSVEQNEHQSGRDKTQQKDSHTERKFGHIYNFGDGGLIENTGIVSLLKRRVPYIVVFLNTRAPLKISHPIFTTDVSEDLSIPFGAIHYDSFREEKRWASVTKRKFFNYYPRKLKRFRTRIDWKINHVFRDEKGKKYKELVDALYKKRMHGESAMYEDEYETVDNEFHGIKGGFKVRVLWVYNAAYQDFEQNALSPELRDELKIRSSQGDFKRFPHFRTAAENSKSLAGLKTVQTNLLSYQHTYNILAHKKWFLDFYERAKGRVTNTSEHVD